MKEKRKRLYAAVGVLSTAMILAVVNWIILPATVVIQINMQGAVGNTAPKIIGVLIPLLVSGAFAVLFYRFGDKRHFLLSVLGLLLGIILLIFNRVLPI